MQGELTLPSLALARIDLWTELCESEKDVETSKKSSLTSTGTLLQNKEDTYIFKILLLSVVLNGDNISAARTDSSRSFESD